MTGLMLLYLRRETSPTVKVMRPNTERGLANSVLSNQSTVGGQKMRTNNVHSRKNTHPQLAPTKLQHTHTHTLPYTQPISYLLADTHTPTQTHASITSLFFPSQIKTQSHTQIHIYSTRQISLTARLAHTTLILMGNSDYSDGSFNV